MSLHIIKDPDATLDFAFNWSDWLSVDETIINYMITVEDGIILETEAPHAQSENNGKIIYWLSGGTPGVTYKVTCKIVTSADRIDERTMRIQVSNR